MILDQAKVIPLKNVVFTPEFSGEEDDWPHRGIEFVLEPKSVLIYHTKLDFATMAAHYGMSSQLQMLRLKEQQDAAERAAEALKAVGRATIEAGNWIDPLGVDKAQIEPTNRAARRRQARLDKRSGTR